MKQVNKSPNLASPTLINSWENLQNYLTALVLSIINELRDHALAIWELQFEHGTFDPEVSFSTPGNLSVAYSNRSGNYRKVGSLVTITFAFVTSTFTHTTAVGDLVIKGLPFLSKNATFYRVYAPLIFQGINKASYTFV